MATNNINIKAAVFIGLLVLAVELLSCHANDVQPNVRVLNTDTNAKNSLVDHIKPLPDFKQTKKGEVLYQTKKQIKQPKCACDYCAILQEFTQCAKLSINPTVPPPPSPSSQNSSVKDASVPPLQINGIFPSLTATASSGPQRSECGTGALMPWADKLYMVSYLSTYQGGSGTGLFAIDENFTITRLASHNSTYANRIIHKETNQIVIGAWVIDLAGNVRTFKDLLTVRIGGTAEHLTHPSTMVYMLGMDGPLWECNVTSLQCTQLFDLVKTLNIPESSGQQPHFKAAHTMNGRLVVASNTFDVSDFTEKQHGGRLAEWLGPGHNWTIIATTAFVEVTGRRNFGHVIYALGWDERSVILKVFDGDSTEDDIIKQNSGRTDYREGFGESITRTSAPYNYWQTYRLPKASHAYDHLWQTEWPRIREVETERYLIDMHGMFYELSPLGWAGSTWGLRPISQHLRMIPDFASFRGLLVLGGNQVSSIFDNNVVTGQAQSGLWFGKTDDLWSFGKPKGWGAVWRNDSVSNGDLSDPYLMTGFDKKVLHLILTDDTFTSVTIDILVDVTGAAGHIPQDPWVLFKSVFLSQQIKYFYVTFPDGYSAHWVRLQARNPYPNKSCSITAYFHYT